VELWITYKASSLDVDIVMRIYINLSDQHSGSDGNLIANFTYAVNSADNLVEPVQVIVAFRQAPED
jgi:hypothetical protein